MTCRPPCLRLGTSSIGSLSEPTVMAVRSSRYSTGLMADVVPQALKSTVIRQMATAGRRMGLSIAGREPEPIIELHRPGILLPMIMRLGRFSATSALMCLVMATGALSTSVAISSESELADRVVVHKSEHKLYLYNGEHLMGVYKVALGLSPVGQKERERDFRTPEGHYYLARRNTRSDFFLAIQVSYPNKEDELRAHKKGWAPGGSIMIHGYPNSPHHPSEYYESNDWTDVCIALSNSDMVQVWMRTQDNSPIDIYPYEPVGQAPYNRCCVVASILSSDMVDARVAPKGSLEHLSQQEIAKLLDSGQGGLYPLFRKGALAVLNCGSDIDDARGIFEKYRDFELRIVRQAWGIKLEIKNAPAAAFVDGVMIRGLKDHLFAVLRDVVFISNEIIESGRFDLNSSSSITNAVFHILRNARVLECRGRP